MLMGDSGRRDFMAPTREGMKRRNSTLVDAQFYSTVRGVSG